jgi:hypothetical protein
MTTDTTELRRLHQPKPTENCAACLRDEPGVHEKEPVPGSTCRTCNEAWPCGVPALLDELDALRVVRGVPLILTVEADGSISRIAGGPLEEPIDTSAHISSALVEAIMDAAELLDMAGSTLGAANLRAALEAAR